MLRNGRELEKTLLCVMIFIQINFSLDFTDFTIHDNTHIDSTNIPKAFYHYNDFVY